MATVNVGAGDTLTVSADTEGAILPVNIFICQTDPQEDSHCSCRRTAASPPRSFLTRHPLLGFSPAAGDVSFVPETNRVYVRFKDSNDITRGLYQRGHKDTMIGTHSTRESKEPVRVTGILKASRS